MAEVTQPGSPAPQAAPAAPETPAELSPSEQVYKEFNIEAEAQSFNPQSPQPATTQAQPSQPPFKVPDPFDPNFASYQAQMAQGVTSINQALQATRQELGTLRQQLNHERTEADIQKAVGTIATESGLDRKFAEVAFQLRAKEDPRLLTIWNNRSKNPTALDKALKAVAAEFKQTYTIRQDPQLVENQRAVKVSQQQMATTQKTSDADRWANMSYEERRKEADRIKRG
jgi:hypothetical protein